MSATKTIFFIVIQRYVLVLFLWVCILAVSSSEVLCQIRHAQSNSWRCHSQMLIQAIAKCVAVFLVYRAFERLEECNQYLTRHAIGLPRVTHGFITAFFLSLISTYFSAMYLCLRVVHISYQPVDVILTLSILLSWNFHNHIVVCRAVAQGGSLVDVTSQLSGDVLLEALAKCLAVGLGMLGDNTYMYHFCLALIVTLLSGVVHFLLVFPCLLEFSQQIPKSHNTHFSNSVVKTKAQDHAKDLHRRRPLTLIMTLALVGIHLIHYLKDPFLLPALSWISFHEEHVDAIVSKHNMKDLILSNYDYGLVLVFVVFLQLCRNSPIKPNGAMLNCKVAVKWSNSEGKELAPVSKCNGVHPAAPTLSPPRIQRQLSHIPSPPVCQNTAQVPLSSARDSSIAIRRRTRSSCDNVSPHSPIAPSSRTVEEQTKMIHEKKGSLLPDNEILQMLQSGALKSRQLETTVRDFTRAVNLRRRDLASRLAYPHCVEGIPWMAYDYKAVINQCCEEVIGYTTVPLGKVGPLLCDGEVHYIPMATTEGCLIASTNRGCRVVEKAGGVNTLLYNDQMTRAPVLRFNSLSELGRCKEWVESTEGFSELKQMFDSTSEYAELLSIMAFPTGRLLHLRFSARTGSAMGMNMTSKGSEKAMQHLLRKFSHSAKLLSLSGNMCSDKKPCAINAILGRGKSVVAECLIPGQVLREVLHVDAMSMEELCRAKNFAGSAAAGGLGMAAANAHAANVCAAVFLATGQDLGQVVESSNCFTNMERLRVEDECSSDEEHLLVTVTMPSLEVGTLGGGTKLMAQSSCLCMLDLSVDNPCGHFARLIAATVLAAELSLMGALINQELVQAHMRYNRRNTQHVSKVEQEEDEMRPCVLVSPRVPTMPMQSDAASHFIM